MPTATTPISSDNLERDSDNFLTHLDEGQKIYRAVGDCAPAFDMIGTLIGTRSQEPHSGARDAARYLPEKHRHSEAEEGKAAEAVAA